MTNCMAFGLGLCYDTHLYLLHIHEGNGRFGGVWVGSVALFVGPAFSGYGRIPVFCTIMYHSVQCYSEGT